jgi:hypothetical protein
MAVRGARLVRAAWSGLSLASVFPAVRALALASSLLVLGACVGTQPASTCRGSTVKLRQSSVLSFGTDLGFPPFAFPDPETGEPSGYEVELAALVASMVGLELDVQHRSASALLPGVVGQRHDLAASALRDTPAPPAPSRAARAPPPRAGGAPPRSGRVRPNEKAEPACSSSLRREGRARMWRRLAQT